MKAKISITFNREVNPDDYPNIEGTLELETAMVEEIHADPELIVYYLEQPFEADVKISG